VKLDQSPYWCEPDLAITFPPVGVRPPQLYAYPPPKPPVQLLLIGWNPPRPFGGFWSLDHPDELREALHDIFRRLGRISAPSPDGDFLDEFRTAGYYFIHAVKCWTAPAYPGFGRGRRASDRVAMGIPLLRACVAMHLAAELKTLSPRRVCAFGELAYLALREPGLYPHLPRNVRPGEGGHFNPNEYGLKWPLLYTCLPLGGGPRAGGRYRDIARGHLQRFLSEFAE